MERIKRTISVLLIIMLTIGRLGPRLVLAEEIGEGGQEEEQQVEQTAETEDETETETVVEPEVSPDPSPTPEPGTEIDNEAEVSNDVDSTAISGENAIAEPTPTPTPTSTPVATPEGEPEGTDDSSCQAEAEGDCPEQTEPEGEAESEGTGESETTPAEIDTGDAVSVVEVENSVNTTEVGTQVLYQTLNIFFSGDIDLSVSPLAIAESIFSENTNEPVINVAVLGVDNIAYLSNDIVSFANSGNNSINGAENAVINTGDAYSIVSLLNKVNSTIVDSTIHIVTINIFGNVEGNIMLPELSAESGQACCGDDVQINNQAVVENNVDSSAVSGQNTITTTDTESASINTGSATSTVNMVNIVNRSLIDVVFHYLYINTFGTWIGDFLGWDDLEALEGGGSLSLSSTQSSQNGNGQCPGCVGDVSIGNEAYVTNNVSSTANSGGNSINGNGGTINTGHAYSVVSIFNLINSSIINSVGFFGSINIFGFLGGDIGGASLFASEEPEAVVEDEGEPGPSTREAGGELNIYQYHNVGTHVLPGDTVTFFVTVRNPGIGRVYDTKLIIDLYKDGVNMGGAEFELGEIKQGEGVKVTTGLVLSEDAEPGDYMAHAEVFGYIGPDNELISAYSDSFFKIVAATPLPIIPGIVEETQAAIPEEEILGAITPPSGLSREQQMQLFLVGLLATYIPAKGYQKREELGVAFVNGKKFVGSKSAAFRSFLTSFFA